MVRISAPPSCMAVAIEWRKMWQAPDLLTPDCLMYRLAYSVSESGCSGLPSTVRNSVCSLGSMQPSRHHRCSRSARIPEQPIDTMASVSLIITQRKAQPLAAFEPEPSPSCNRESISLTMRFIPRPFQRELWHRQICTLMGLQAVNEQPHGQARATLDQVSAPEPPVPPRRQQDGCVSVIFPRKNSSTSRRCQNSCRQQVATAN